MAYGIFLDKGMLLEVLGGSENHGRQIDPTWLYLSFGYFAW